MLNEAYDLRRNLDEIGFDIPVNHPDVKTPGKNQGYILKLGRNGLLHTIDEIDKESMGELWCHRDAKQNAFPVVKIQNPLLSIPINDQIRNQLSILKKSDQTKRIDIIFDAMTTHKFIISDKDKRAWNRLRDKALSWLDLFLEIDDNYLALPCMLRRFVESVSSPLAFISSLGNLIAKRIRQGQLQDIKLAEKTLIGVPEKKRPDKLRCEIPIALDIAETNYPISVGDPRMKSFVSRFFLSNEISAPDGICALEGTHRPLVKKRFPEPNIGALGETKLFSKNKATPCEFRYIKNPKDREDASKSFPISKSLAADISDGLNALTAITLKGKTWRMVANGKWEGGRNKKERKDLLLIYGEGQPVISDEAADIFGSDETEKRDQFENEARALCLALDGIKKHRPHSRLHILLIGKADKEKKQVIMHLTPTPQELQDAAERWHQAVQFNLPDIVIHLPPKEKGQNAVARRPKALYPDRVVRILSSKWVRGGLDELKLEGPALCQVLDLMLKKTGKWKGAATNLLELSIHRTGPLLVGLAAALNSRDIERMEKYKSFSRLVAIRSVALLGILLDAFDRKKEVYMTDTAFQLGRLLSMADTLHREYCMHMRRGSIPSQLIGNALMPAAAGNPEDAIDRLRERLNIYQAWASKNSGEEYRLAKWALAQMGEISNTIKRPLPTKTDQTFRAELFLGYMARTPKESE